MTWCCCCLFKLEKCIFSRTISGLLLAIDFKWTMVMMSMALVGRTGHLFVWSLWPFISNEKAARTICLWPYLFAAKVHIFAPFPWWHEINIFYKVATQSPFHSLWQHPKFTSLTAFCSTKYFNRDVKEVAWKCILWKCIWVLCNVSHLLHTHHTQYKCKSALHYGCLGA